MSNCRRDLRAWITDPAQPDAYPIVTYTWLLCYKKYQDPKTADAIKSIVQYGLGQGQSFATELGYIPLPTDTIKQVTAALNQIS